MSYYYIVVTNIAQPYLLAILGCGAAGGGPAANGGDVDRVGGDLPTDGSNCFGGGGDGGGDSPTTIKMDDTTYLTPT